MSQISTNSDMEIILARMGIKSITSGKGNGISQNCPADRETGTQTGTRTGNLGLFCLETGVYNGVSTSFSHTDSKKGD